MSPVGNDMNYPDRSVAPGVIEKLPQIRPRMNFLRAERNVWEICQEFPHEPYLAAGRT